MKMKTVKIGRNDPCPCGSGLKHKKCCLGKSDTGIEDIETTYARKYNIRLKKAADIEGIRKAGRLVLDTLDLMASKIKPGITTDDLNTLADICPLCGLRDPVCLPISRRVIVFSVGSLVIVVLIYFT